MNTEDVIFKAANLRAQVETNIVDQQRIRDTATLTIDNLENCFQTIIAAQATAAANHAESEIAFNTQVIRTHAWRNFSVTF